MRHPRTRRSAGTTKLEQLFLIVAIACAGLAPFAKFGQSVSHVIGTSVSSDDAATNNHGISLAGRSFAGALGEIAKVARRASEIVRGNKVVKLADLPASSAYLRPDIPLEKVAAASEFLDDAALARVHSRQLRSVDDIVVIDVEVTSNRSRGADAYAQQWGVGEIGVSYVDANGVQKRRIDLDYVEGHVASRRLAEREFRDVVDYDAAIVEVASEAFDKELGFYNAAWDTKRLLQGIDDAQDEGVTRIGKERYASLNKIDELRASDAERYATIRAQISEVMADYRAQRATGTIADLKKWRTKMQKDFGVDVDDFMLSEFRHRLRSEEPIDILDAVRLYENDGRGNKLEPTSLRVLPKNSPFALAEDTAHFGDADAAATLEIARQSTGIRKALERDLPQYLRNQLAYRLLSDEARRVVGAGFEGDKLGRRSLSTINFGFMEVASTKPRGKDGYGQLTKIGFGERAPRTRFQQVGKRFVPSFVMDGIGDDELFVRPVKYRTPNSRKHQPRSFVDADIDNQATRQSGIEDSSVRGEKALGEAPQPTFIQRWDDLRERFDGSNAWVSWNAGEEVGVLGREVTPFINIEGETSLPASLRREFVDLERLILNSLDDNSKKMIRMELNISAKEDLHLPIRKAYQLITGEKTRAPTGSIAQNARIARAIFEDLQGKGAFGKTWDDLLKAQRGEGGSAKLYYDNGRIRVRGDR